jgi:hypothetical protein
LPTASIRMTAPRPTLRVAHAGSSQVLKHLQHTGRSVSAGHGPCQRTQIHRQFLKHLARLARSFYRRLALASAFTGTLLCMFSP